MSAKMFVGSFPSVGISFNIFRGPGFDFALYFRRYGVCLVSVGFEFFIISCIFFSRNFLITTGKFPSLSVM